jgi:Rps23 Pro-64 3,4-dihydroxylase Tpa1-like proline 4-hydroxylase
MSDEGVSIANEFAEPEEDGVYVTIHQRPSQPMPALERLNLAFGSRDMVKLMAQLYGGMLSDKGHCGVLTCWGPHAFIDPHTDQGTDAEPSRIAIALSLTDGWNPDHGGKTYFQWEDGGRIVCVRPRLNNAIIFATSKDSNHWVEQISGEAPERTRFTWTFSYL